MNLIKILQGFATEEQCQKLLQEKREKEGVVCKSCGSTHHYWIKSINYRQCKECRFHTSLKSGDYMENSKLPVRALLGIYHKIKGGFLQLYLDEFCYKLNRGCFGNKHFIGF